MSDWIRPRKDGVEIAVRLTPRSSTDRVDGVSANADGVPHLAARVRAVPEKGKANAALEALIAAWLHVPKRTVSVEAGTTSRLKTVSISGDVEELRKKLSELSGQHGH